MHEITRADTLLQTLQIRYGGQFRKRYDDVSVVVMRNVVNNALTNLSDDQFNAGLARLNSSRFCPDIAEFQSWCVAGSWWTVAEAWQRACDYSNLSSHEIAKLANMKPEVFMKSNLKITSLTKKAWDSVSWLVNQGDMQSAHREFKSLYLDYVAKAQSLGRQQEWYVPPKQIGCSSFVAESKPKSKLPEQSPEQKNWIKQKTAELQATGLSFPKAMFEAMKMLKMGEVARTCWGN